MKKLNENKSSKLLYFLKNNKMCILLQYFVLVYHFICENNLTTSICKFLRTVHDIVMKTVADMDMKTSFMMPSLIASNHI